MVRVVDLILRFCATTERCGILHGFLDYREALRQAGLVSGMQWVNGSFLEHVERTRLRPPQDIDVVTFFNLQNGMTEQDVYARDPAVFNHDQVKSDYKVDGYLVNLGTGANEPLELVRESSYWYSVWSHRRDDALWKGFLQINLVDDDSTARDILNSAGATL